MTQIRAKLTAVQSHVSVNEKYSEQQLKYYKFADSSEIYR